MAVEQELQDAIWYVESSGEKPDPIDDGPFVAHRFSAGRVIFFQPDSRGHEAISPL
jgi:hypothetical protein